MIRCTKSRFGSAEMTRTSEKQCFWRAVVFVVVNLLVDVVYMIINPRVSYDSKGGN